MNFVFDNSKIWNDLNREKKLPNKNSFKHVLKKGSLKRKLFHDYYYCYHLFIYSFYFTFFSVPGVEFNENEILKNLCKSSCCLRT